MYDYMEHISTFIEGKTTTQRIGHNFSVDALKKYAKTYEACNRKVKDILKLVDKYNAKYVVAYIKGDIHTKKHELLHAKFHNNVEYRSYVFSIWNNLESSTRNNISLFLKKLGYPEHVIIDEFQAYLFTEKPKFFGCTIEL
jgi:hypothetical protein